MAGAGGRLEEMRRISSVLVGIQKDDRKREGLQRRLGEQKTNVEDKCVGKNKRLVRLCRGGLNFE